MRTAYTPFVEILSDGGQWEVVEQYHDLNPPKCLRLRELAMATREEEEEEGEESGK